MDFEELSSIFCILVVQILMMPSEKENIFIIERHEGAPDCPLEMLSHSHTIITTKLN